MNHPDSPCDWKSVKYPINTCTTLRNDDVIVTSLKNAILYTDSVGLQLV